jgi:hypothetical protein
MFASQPSLPNLTEIVLICQVRLPLSMVYSARNTLRMLWDFQNAYGVIGAEDKNLRHGCLRFIVEYMFYYPKFSKLCQAEDGTSF